MFYFDVCLNLIAMPNSNLKFLVVVLCFILLISNLVIGLLYVQLGTSRTVSSELRSEIAELQNQTSELEAMQSLNNELQFQNSELQLQNNELQNRVSELETQLGKGFNRVNITGFSLYGFFTLGGLLVFSYPNVTIQNFGGNDVQNLTLTIVSSTASEWVSTKRIDFIRAGETRVITGKFYWMLGGNGTTTATIKLGDVVLDECITYTD